MSNIGIFKVNPRLKCLFMHSKELLSSLKIFGTQSNTKNTKGLYFNMHIAELFSKVMQQYLRKEHLRMIKKVTL